MASALLCGVRVVARTALLLLAFATWGVADACPNCAGNLEGSEATAYLAVTGVMIALPAVFLAGLYGWFCRANRSGSSAPDFSPPVNGDFC